MINITQNGALFTISKSRHGYIQTNVVTEDGYILYIHFNDKHEVTRVDSTKDSKCLEFKT